VSAASFAQETNKKVVITGARFTYPLVQRWIDQYNEANPFVEVVIEPRSTTDPDKYDLLIEAYELNDDVREEREFLSFGRYALLPIANDKSQFARIYSDKGLTKELIQQIFFHDIYAEKEKQKEIKAPYTVYTRLQKAGAPTTFAKYFGYDQQSIKGKAIAGADEHLIKALLKDTTAISYNNAGLIYDLKTRKALPGIAILPVDTDDNGRVSNEEKERLTLDDLISKLEKGELENIPVEHLHLSIKKRGYNPEALKFLLFVIQNGQNDLHQFGFLTPDQRRFENERERFEHMASRK
jgi:phosphate transport system substrate-binding protein